MLKLPSIISDYMLINADVPVRLYGIAVPFAPVRVVASWLAGEAKTVADAAGSWELQVSGCVAGLCPQSLRFESCGSVLEVVNILFGMLFLASGQSNIDMPMAPYSDEGCFGVKDYEKEIDAASYPLIRLFKTERCSAATKQDDVRGRWMCCTPENVAQFQAIPYFFAEAVHRAEGIPVGMVASCWGGTSINAWLAEEMLLANVNCRRLCDQIRYFELYRNDRAKFQQEVGTFYQQQPGVRPDFELPRRMPSGAFNGMIYPLHRVHWAGILWFQGERDAMEASMYAGKFTDLVKSWRNLFEDPELPFIYAQLSARGEGSSTDAYDPESNWAVLRCAQNALLRERAVTMVSTIDLGERGNIHFSDKRPAAERMAQAYRSLRNHTDEMTGILPFEAKTAGNQVTLRFPAAAGRLQFRDDKKSKCIIPVDSCGNEIAYERLEADENILYLYGCRQAPAALRYAWADNPESILFTGSGLPVGTFHIELDTVLPKEQ